MKKQNTALYSCLLFVFASQITRVIQADQSELMVPALSHERIELARKTYAKEAERARTIQAAVKVGTYGAIAGSVGYMAWSFFKPQVPHTTPRSFDDIITRYNNLTEEQKRAVAQRIDRAMGVFDNALPENSWWKAKSAALFAGATMLCKSAGFSFLQSKLVQLASSFVPGDFNALADYLGASRNLTWYIKKHTSFDLCTNNVYKWVSFAKKAESNAAQELVRKQYTSMVAITIAQIEKILGFMQYTTDLLPESAAIEKNRAAIIIEHVTKLAEQLATIPSTRAAERAEALTLLFIGLKNQFEYFKEIEQVLGLEQDTEQAKQADAQESIKQPALQSVKLKTAYL